MFFLTTFTALASTPNVSPSVLNSIPIPPSSHLQLTILCYALIILLLYYAIFIVFFKHTPKMPLVTPVFHIPENLSASACRYILNMNYDRKAFLTSLFELTIKGYLKINNNSINRPYVERTTDKALTPPNEVEKN